MALFYSSPVLPFADQLKILPGYNCTNLILLSALGNRNLNEIHNIDILAHVINKYVQGWPYK